MNKTKTLCKFCVYYLKDGGCSFYDPCGITFCAYNSIIDDLRYKLRSEQIDLQEIIECLKEDLNF